MRADELVTTLYDEFRTVAGGMSGYSFRVILTRQDLLDEQSQRCIKVCYRTTDIYAAKEKQVLVRGLHYSQLAEQENQQNDADWRARAQSIILAYLHLRLADCKNNPDVRFDKISLANRALEFFRALPEILTKQHWDAWLVLRNAPTAQKTYLSSNKLHNCFSQLHELIQMQFPLELSADSAPSSASEREAGVELPPVGSSIELSADSAPSSASEREAGAELPPVGLSMPRQEEWMTVFGKIRAAAAARKAARAESDVEVFTRS